MRALLPPDTLLRRNRVLGYSFALAACALAAVTRMAVANTLPPGYPFLTFFPAVILSTFLAGLGPGVVCAVLSGLLAWLLFIPPANSLALNGGVALAMGFYVFVVAVDITLIHGMDRAAQRLRAERRLTDRLYDQQRTMFQELQHRVANSMSFVASILYLQKGRIAGTPEAAHSALDAAAARLESMSRIHRRLHDPAGDDLPLQQFLDELCSDLLEISGSERVQVSVSAADQRFDIGRKTTLALLVTELVTNALKHAFSQGAAGNIRVALTRPEPGRLELEVADDGRGLDPGLSSPPGLGTRIAASLARQLGGDLTTESDGGVRTRVRFPA